MEELEEKKKVKIVRRPKQDVNSWSYPQMIELYVPAYWEKYFDRIADERRDIAATLNQKIFSVGTQVYPPKEKVYAAFDKIRPEKVKVVIIGQDPYPQEGKAQGLAFSIDENDRDINGSLKNIFLEIKREYPDFVIPKHGNLTKWTKEGVLLLNMSLTVSAGVPDSHKTVWNQFVNKIVKYLTEDYPNIIFVIWGRKAEAILRYIGNNPHFVSGHPSPQAVKMGGDFLGNGHFKKVNDLLESWGDKAIDWQI